MLTAAALLLGFLLGWFLDFPRAKGQVRSRDRAKGQVRSRDRDEFELVLTVDTTQAQAALAELRGELEEVATLASGLAFPEPAVPLEGPPLGCDGLPLGYTPPCPHSAREEL